MPTPPIDVKSKLVSDAAALGFDAIRVTRPDAIGEASGHFAAFLAAGRHGDMDWLEKNSPRRSDPKILWPEVRSVVMLGMSYAPPSDPLDALAQRSNSAISVYAKGRDYHDVIKSKLIAIARLLQDLSGADVKVFVDTAPLMEKPLAAAAGVGWQGKHTNLVSRQFGSWLFLGSILTTAELEPDSAIGDHCGSCRRCLDICPTRAFPAPYELDARRCIAYLTIEHKGHIAPEFRQAMGNRVFGCDDCLAVCPWNKFAEASREMKFSARTETDNPLLSELLALDDAAFRKRFAGTPIKRTGRNRFLRNVLIAAGNSQDMSHLGAIRELLGDPAPLVRAMAVWALRRLTADAGIAALRQRSLEAETDADVLQEWR